jgi:hypothetical protein
MSDGIGAGIMDIGGGIGSLFGAQGSQAAAEGDKLAAKSFGEAEQIARQNARYTELSTAITENQLHRQVLQVVGKQQAQIAGGNLTGGSAEDLKRSSLMQGNLAGAVMNISGAIQKNSFLQQATAYEGQQAAELGKAGAEEAAAAGGMFGGMLKIGAGLFSMFGA